MGSRGPESTVGLLGAPPQYDVGTAPQWDTPEDDAPKDARLKDDDALDNSGVHQLYTAAKFLSFLFFEGDFLRPHSLNFFLYSFSLESIRQQYICMRDLGIYVALNLCCCSISLITFRRVRLLST